MIYLISLMKLMMNHHQQVKGPPLTTLNLESHFLRLVPTPNLTWMSWNYSDVYETFGSMGNP
ncbi:MAG: hypothetical protein AAFV97_03395 [Bacteroidota bacterium]